MSAKASQEADIIWIKRLSEKDASLPGWCPINENGKGILNGMDLLFQIYVIPSPTKRHRSSWLSDLWLKGPCTLAGVNLQGTQAFAHGLGCCTRFPISLDWKWQFVELPDFNIRESIPILNHLVSSIHLFIPLSPYLIYQSSIYLPAYHLSYWLCSSVELSDMWSFIVLISTPTMIL